MIISFFFSPSSCSSSCCSCSATALSNHNNNKKQRTGTRYKNNNNSYAADGAWSFVKSFKLNLKFLSASFRFAWFFFRYFGISNFRFLFFFLLFFYVLLYFAFPLPLQFFSTVFVLNSTHFHHLFSKYFILLLLGLDTHTHTHAGTHIYTAHTDAQRGCSYSACFIQNFCKKLFRIVLRGEARRFVYVAFHMYPTTGTPWLTLAADAHLAAGSRQQQQYAGST